MRVQAASTERTSACRDVGLSDERRAQAVSTTAVANAEKSALGADAMHTTMPLKKASFPGRGRWDASPCGRDEGEGAAVAPAAADATDRARACYAFFAARDASRARGLRLFDIVKPSSACYRLVGVVERPLGPRCRICHVQGGGMGASISGALGVALCRARRAQVAAVVPCPARGGAAGGALPGLARAAVETPPSPVEVGPSSSLREPASRPSWLVGPGGGMVLRLLSRHRNPPLVVPPVSSRGISSELSLSRGHPGWGTWKISACPE